MVVQIENIVKDDKGLKGFVLNFEGDKLYVSRYSHDKGVAFCFMPKIVDNFEPGKDGGSFVFNVNEHFFGMKLYTEETPRDVVYECFRIYSAGLKWMGSSREFGLSQDDLRYFNQIERFLASGAIKKAKAMVRKYRA